MVYKTRPQTENGCLETNLLI